MNQLLRDNVSSQADVLNPSSDNCVTQDITHCEDPRSGQIIDEAPPKKSFEVNSLEAIVSC